MRFRVSSWRHVFAYSSLTTALAIAVPLVAVSILFWSVPLQLKMPFLVISVAIPLFITFPISVFALYMFKLIDQTVSVLDQLVKLDPLTGLLSRPRFLQLMEERRYVGGYLAILDADHFKIVNDTYGHQAGDETLKHIATIMTQVVGNSGIVGRLGGEEFAIYLPAVTRQQAELILAQTGSALRNQSFHYQGVDIVVTVSAGLVADHGTENQARLLHSADECLYKAKHNGRDQYIIEDVLDRRSVSAA